MSASEPWIVPGAPLARGRGWRLWFSRRDGKPLVAPQVTVTREGGVESCALRWMSLPDLEGFDRRAGILEIELTTPRPGSLYEVSIPTVSEQPFRWRTLPDRLRPNLAGPQDAGSLTLLLASCFYRPNDAEGVYAGAVKDLCKQNAIGFKLLVGDQLYQDWPPSLPPAPPIQSFTDRYESYWGDEAYRDALGLTPNLFVCDDHEFWNDYPERQFQLANTWTLAQRQSYGAAGRATFGFYQRAPNPDGAAFFTLDVPPLSMFVADTRSERDPIASADPHFFSQAQWSAFDAWIQGLQGPGVLVLGQPLFQAAGDWRDHTLANFQNDYDRLWQSIESLLRGSDQRARHDLLVLSGDIHWGRYAVSETATGGRLHEFVASAASNIASGPFVGERKKALAPSKITVQSVGGVRSWTVTTAQEGELPTNDNNVGLLRFAAGTNARVRCQAECWSIRSADKRWFWQRALGERPPQPRLNKRLETEFDLA